MSAETLKVSEIRALRSYAEGLGAVVYLPLVVAPIAFGGWMLFGGRILLSALIAAGVSVALSLLTQVRYGAKPASLRRFFQLYNSVGFCGAAMSLAAAWACAGIAGDAEVLSLYLVQLTLAQLGLAGAAALWMASVWKSEEAKYALIRTYRAIGKIPIGPLLDTVKTRSPLDLRWPVFGLCANGSMLLLSILGRRGEGTLLFFVSALGVFPYILGVLLVRLYWGWRYLGSRDIQITAE